MAVDILLTGLEVTDDARDLLCASSQTNVDEESDAKPKPRKKEMDESFTCSSAALYDRLSTRSSLDPFGSPMPKVYLVPFLYPDDARACRCTGTLGCPGKTGLKFCFSDNV
jgi:hypothetical protein